MNPSSNLIRDIIHAAGGAKAIAAALGVNPSAVNNWTARGAIPAEHCPTLERLSGGAYRCEAMCPGVEWGVLRGTDAAPVFSSGASSTP